MMANRGHEYGEDVFSWLLTHLCEDVGFSEEKWRLRLRTFDILSVSDDGLQDIAKFMYSGSCAEGLASEIIGSDIDIMFVLNGIKVLEHGEVSQEGKEDVYKANSSNHPAFYTMNFNQAGNSSNDLNRAIRLCLKRDPRNNMVVLSGTVVKDMCTARLLGVQNWDQLVQHGPALTSKRDMDRQDMDIVLSLHCPSWPSMSEEWKQRPRQYDWPSQDRVHKVTQLGCEFVPIGNPLSSHNDIEWRLSSSAAEKVLIRSLNIVQIQCYFLMKMALVYLIKPRVPDTLCSYHMKNILLWQVEKTDPQMWRGDNLAHCFTECLKALYLCVEHGHLPQYFIPQQNLFFPKIQGDVKRLLTRVVGELLQEGCPCLLRCVPFTSIEIGCRHNSPRCPCYIGRMTEQRTARHIVELIEQLPYILNGITENVNRATRDTFIETISSIKTLQEKRIFDEIYRPSQHCIELINTSLVNHLGYMMLTVTREPHVQSNAKMYQVLQHARQYLENSCDVDLTSGRLKLATFYYKLGLVHKCIRVVHDVLVRFSDRTVVFIPEKVVEKNQGLKDPRVLQCLRDILSSSEDLRCLLSQVSFPVLFSQWEVINAPAAVHTLVFNRQCESGSNRHDSVTVDSRVYAYFLLTTCYREIGRHREANKSLDNLRRVMRHPRHYQLYYLYEAHHLLNYIA